MKYLVVTGGVVSGLGKGVTISSVGRILQAAGVRVTAVKIDPYLNVDAGTMSPFEHGEVFVLEDGGESDLDLGNYERFLNIRLTHRHNVTTGKIYQQVIHAERRGDYLGKTVQVVPHITDAIQEWLEEVAHIPVQADGSGAVADVCLIEVGGTVGDIESSVFLEALRQFQFRVGHEHFCLCFVSLVPILSDEQKTKPTQHGVRDLRSLGLSPSIIFCRSSAPLEDATKQKISSFCHVRPENVFSVHNVDNVYHVPALLQSQGLHTILQKELSHTTPLEPDLTSWIHMAESVENATEQVSIALIGKYTGLQDSYLSVLKALQHACIACHVRLVVEWIEASDLVEPTSEGYATARKKLETSHGVVIPGGFGQRGWEGKIYAAQYCRENSKPVLGVCLGFQAMVVEYSRTILGLKAADSTEFTEDTSEPTVIFMPEIDKDTMGGTMRLGARTTHFTHHYPDGSMSTTQLLYHGAHVISERHRHRYEVNPDKVAPLHNDGLLLVGRDETGTRMEIAELERSQHPYYVGCQFHPEFLSRPLAPSPPFYGLILAATDRLTAHLEHCMNDAKDMANGVANGHA
jgi:CTP synthase